MNSTINTLNNNNDDDWKQEENSNNNKNKNIFYSINQLIKTKILQVVLGGKKKTLCHHTVNINMWLLRCSDVFLCGCQGALTGSNY